MQELSKLIGDETVFEIDYISDSQIFYSNVIKPYDDENGYFLEYRISVFNKKSNFLKYEKFKDLKDKCIIKIIKAYHYTHMEKENVLFEKKGENKENNEEKEDFSKCLIDEYGEDDIVNKIKNYKK